MVGFSTISRSSALEPEPAYQEDHRFRALMSPQDWSQLPYSVQARFSSKAVAGQAIVFIGHVVDLSVSRLGRLIATACKLVGASWPISPDIGAACVVAITEDQHSDGQYWTRLFAGCRGHPQVIQSSMRFAGPTGLEERIKGGVGITLQVSSCTKALIFVSDRYFFEISGRRFYLPTFLTPGRLTVRHVARGKISFDLTLTIEHPRFGLLLRQVISFGETPHDL